MRNYKMSQFAREQGQPLQPVYNLIENNRRTSPKHIVRFETGP